MSTPQQQLQDALAAHRRGDLDRAEAGYRAILRAQPRHFDATQLLGAVLTTRGKHKESIALIRRAVAMKPDAATLHNNLGRAVHALGQAEESLTHFDRAVALDPKYVDAFNNRGNILLDLGRSKEALADYDRALALNPDLINALQKSARILSETGRFDEALARNARALAAAQPTAEMYLRSGNVLLHCQKYEEALSDYAKALTIDPKLLQARTNRASTFETLGRLEEGISELDRALILFPDHPELLYDKATLLKGMKRMDEACDYYRRALAIAPDEANANANYGMVLMLMGDYAAGFPHYEFRWQQKVNAGKRPRFAAPLWQGEPLEGRSLVVFAEQGLGDIVQFSRYLPLLQGRGANVTFLVTEKMHAVLRAAFPGIELTAETKATLTRPFDFQVAMMSLPLRFGTRADNIPARIPYLNAEPERVVRWRERMGPQGFKIGICWQGKPDVAIDPNRSFPLSMFAPLAAIPGVRLISLQKNDGVDQIEQSSFSVETLGADFDSGKDAFVDTLAVMGGLDLVITPDTSVAHVAGALGRPVWLALKFMPDWRWMLDREDSPWYPSMRLFRQNIAGDWSDPFTQMRAELERTAR